MISKFLFPKGSFENSFLSPVRTIGWVGKRIETLACIGTKVLLSNECHFLLNCKYLVWFSSYWGSSLSKSRTNWYFLSYLNLSSGTNRIRNRLLLPHSRGCRLRIVTKIAFIFRDRGLGSCLKRLCKIFSFCRIDCASWSLLLLYLHWKGRCFWRCFYRRRDNSHLSTFYGRWVSLPIEDLSRLFCRYGVSLV